MDLITGIDFIWRSPPPRLIDQPNHLSYIQNSTLTNAVLYENLSTGVIEMQSTYFPNHDPTIPHPSFVLVINPLGSTSKKDTTEPRPYIDPTQSGVNMAMAPLPLHLPSWDALLPLIQLGYYLAKADWRHGFHHATLLPTSRQYMGFRLSTGHIGRYKALTFGASQSPALFTAIANEFARLFLL